MSNNKKYYQITYTIYQVISFDDEEMRECGYESEITDMDRKDYLNSLIEDEYNIGIPYDDINIQETCP